MEHIKKLTVSILGAGWLGFPLAKFLLKHHYIIKASTTDKKKLSKIASYNIREYYLKIEENHVFMNPKNFFDTDVLIINFPPRRIENIQIIYPKQVKNIVEYIPTSVQQIIFVSSTSVYPPSLQEVDENCKLIPTKPSGIALLEAEKIIKNNFFNRYLILRLAGLYGKDRPIGKFLSKKKLILHPSDRVNLIHQNDCISIIKQLIQKNIRKETFNVVSNFHPLKKELYQQKALEMGLPFLNFEYSQKPLGKIVSGEKIRKVLSI